MTKTAEELRASAAKHDQAAYDSFERCDTDGFLTQWASGLTAQLERRQADLLENGGLSWFGVLLDANTGEWVPSKLIDGKFGRCWALLGDDGKFTGQFVSAHPKRFSTMFNKGFVEAQGQYPAKAVMEGRGHGLSGTAWVATVKDWNVTNDMTPPSALRAWWGYKSGLGDEYNAWCSEHGVEWGLES